MSLEQTLTKLLSFNTLSSVLVCEAGFTELRAVVIEKKKDKLVASPEIMYSDAADYPSALADIVRKAKLKGWKGKHAILLTPAAITSPILLPIPHKHKVPMPQFEEAVRWELDPLMQQHRQSLLIGHILVAIRGITPEQLAKVVDEQANMDRSKNREVVYKRLGELAIERGFLTPNRLEQAIARQHWFTDDDDEIKCDWHPIKATTELDPGSYPWLGSAINKAVLRKWQAAFAQLGLKLEICYPLSGAALGSSELANHAKASGKTQSEVIIELHPHQVGVAVLVNGVVSQLQSMGCHQSNRLMQITELYHRLGEPSWQHVRLLDNVSKSEQEGALLQEDVAQLINYTVEPVKQHSRSCGLSMIGAAAHAIGLARARNVQGVSVHDPLPPLMQRFEVRAILTVAAFITMLILIELGMLGKQLWIDYQQHLIKDDLAKIEKTRKEIQDNINRVEALKAELKTLETKKKSLTKIQEIYGDKLPTRNEQLHTFLKSFEKSVDDGVVVDKVTENGMRGFTVSAWALEETSAQNFIKRFQMNINPLGYRLKDITISQQTGRLGMVGNGIVFNATLLDDEKWEASKLVPANPPTRIR